jgi:hypothetical protein
MGSLKHPMALVESFQVGDETRVGSMACGGRRVIGPCQGRVGADIIGEAKAGLIGSWRQGCRHTGRTRVAWFP